MNKKLGSSTKRKIEKVFFNYFPIIPSTLIFPGPQNKSVIEAAKKNAPFSPSAKICALEAIKTTTDIPIIIGIQANLVNNPRTRRRPQKNSANMISESEVVEPKFIKFINLKRSVLNWTSLV